MGKTLTLPLVWNKATAKPVLGNTQAGKILVNGIRGSLRQSDFEWHSWESSDSVAFTIDLQKKESLRSVSVGCITNYGMAAHKPADIEVWVSMIIGIIVKYPVNSSRMERFSVKGLSKRMWYLI